MIKRRAFICLNAFPLPSALLSPPALPSYLSGIPGMSLAYESSPTWSPKIPCQGHFKNDGD